MDEEEGEEGWVIVADESSAAGRNEKVQILKDYSNLSLVANNVQSSSQMSRINQRRNSFYSTSSSEDYPGCELSESYRSSLCNSNSIMNSNKILEFIELGSQSVDDPPPQFLCPITREIMTHPVIAEGYFYIILIL